MKEVKFDVYCDSTLFNDRSDLSTWKVNKLELI